MSFLSRLLIIATVASSLLAGCSLKKSTLEKLGGEEVGIFSNRPISPQQFIAVIKLNSPALLTTAKTLNGQSVVNEELMKQIETEQTEAIADLKRLSSDIRVLFRYRMVLNGLAIVAPLSVADKIKARMHVAYVEKEGIFSAPKQIEGGKSTLSAKNSVDFIGADKVHALGIRGQGMKVGIIDTGIDYTHSMFGGPGTEEAYKGTNPDQANSAYPNAKVVGGIDLVGTAYNSGSGDYAKHIPIPDENPLDEGGHGTHVAGTVAGIGDGIETYSGVAPDALLYAIKVFGADGSTGDAVVVAGLEFSADPNRDGKLDDKLDVINMSLGSSYGNPHILYSQAIKNLVAGGTIVVASAGNSGNLDHIVGAPSTSDEAISVAASIDHGDHNWKFNAVEFSTPTAGALTSEAVEGPISLPIAEAGAVSGKLVFIGLADKELAPEIVDQLKGNVALIDRGVVTFAEKVLRAEKAGAIGVVVANNQPGNPFAMGGDGQAKIPAIMISQALGATLKDQMKLGDVVIHFQTEKKIEKPELIDTLTDFSSKGPRSMDSVLKPEISAPGANVISAAMGKGNKGVKLSGTSMSGPHVAGVMALMRQAHPDLTVNDLKSLLMGTAKSIGNEKKENYLLSRQGAGRVQTFEAVTAKLVADVTSISFGEVNMENRKLFRRSVTLQNISKDPVQFSLQLDSDSGFSMVGISSVTLAPQEKKTFILDIALDVSKLTTSISEINGLLKVVSGGSEIHRIPVIAIVKKISQVSGASLKVYADSEASATGAAVDLTVKNKGLHAGVALPFNLLGLDQRKKNAKNDAFLSRACDLQAAGYRIITKVVDGKSLQMLQVGFKIFEPVTTWNACEVSVLIDSTGDRIADQELAGFALGNVPGLSSAMTTNKFTSVLLDAGKTRELRLKFEQETMAGKEVKEDYSDAALDAQSMTVFEHSTVVVIEADVTKLMKNSSGLLSMKLASIFNEASSVEMDDFLGQGLLEWKSLSLDPKAQAFMDLPEKISVPAAGTANASLTKGEGKGSLLILYPDNRGVFSDIQKDEQLEFLKPQFGF